MNNTPTPNLSPKQWLKQLAKCGGRWQRLAKLAGAVQALLIVVQQINPRYPYLRETP